MGFFPAPRSLRPAFKGFTIIELMITLTLMAILTLIAMPSFNVWIANTRVRAVADALQNGLRQAQIEALRRSRQTVFALTDASPTSAAPGYSAAANGNHWAISVSQSTLDSSSVFVQAGLLAEIAPGVSITGPAAACFSALGRLAANNGTGVTGANCALPDNPPADVYVIAQDGADRPLHVEVNLGGQVRLCDPAMTLSSTAPEGCQYQ